MRRSTLYAWLFFFAPFFTVTGLDYGLRLADGDIRTGGLDDTFTLLALLPFAAFACLLLLWASKGLTGWFRRVVFVGLQLALAFVVTQLVALAYVVGLGIDSF